MENKTQVYLVGAGPGDTGLMTVKGMRCLQQADVVLYDKLSNPAFLAEVSPEAELIYVGKVKGNHSLPQEQINDLLVEKARPGRTVVRLKGGDPYIFGRGGEEAQRLADANVPFEVIPGITSAFAASAYAGIPMTHRDFTTSVSLITGHVNVRKDEASDIDWQALASGHGTLAFYMGLGNIGTICRQLIAHGRADSTPVAVISRATTADQQTLTATLSDAAQKVEEHNIPTPALIIVGEVVSLRNELRWFDLKPLFGQRVLCPHTQAGPSSLADRLSELGAQPLRFRVTQESAPSSWQPLDQAIARLSRYQWLLFTTPAVIDGFWKRLQASGLDARALAGIQLVVRGEKTAAALRDKGLHADLQLSVASPLSELPAALQQLADDQSLRGTNLLCPTHEHRSRVNLSAVEQAGIEVNQPVACSTISALGQRKQLEQMLTDGQLDTLCLTSAVSTYALAEILGPCTGTMLAPLKTIAMGEATVKAARRCGIQVDTVAAEPTLDAVIDELISITLPNHQPSVQG